MKLFFIVAFLFFICSHFSFSQNTEKNTTELPADTVEGSSTDTSIIYIIKKPPVKIREKVEVQIQRTKKKQYYYLSLGLSGFVYSENRKAHSGYNDYLKKLNGDTKSLPSFGVGIKLWRSNEKEKFVPGIEVGINKTLQRFNSSDTLGFSHAITNNYNYAYCGFSLGKWLRKGNKISFLPQGGLFLNYFLSAAGFTIDKSNSISLVRVNREMRYLSYTGNFKVGFTTLITLKNSLVEIEPYLFLSPFSLTPKNEAFSLKRNFAGLRIGYTNKLF